MKLLTTPSLEAAINYNEKAWTFLQVVQDAQGSGWSSIYFNPETSLYGIIFSSVITSVFDEDELGILDENGNYANVVESDNFIVFEPEPIISDNELV